MFLRLLLYLVYNIVREIATFIGMLLIPVTLAVILALASTIPTDVWVGIVVTGACVAALVIVFWQERPKQTKERRTSYP